MSSFTQSPVTAQGATDIDEHRRVKLLPNESSPPSIAHASETEVGFGHAQYFAQAGEAVAVKTHTHGGTMLGVAAGAIARSAELFASADGKFADSGAVPLGAIAWTSASADGQVFEVMYL